MIDKNTADALAKAIQVSTYALIDLIRENVDTDKMREEALATLSERALSKDTEGAHMDADDVLCDMLCRLGFEDVVAAYHKVPKWFS